jgi:hypothetical protein
MHFIVSGADGEQVAVQFSITRHGLPVDVILQRLRDGHAVFGHVLHIISKAGIAAKVTLGDGFLRFVKIIVVILKHRTT